MTPRLPILFLLASAALCCAAPMINRNGYGVRGTDPRYFPPGYSQSLLWWKFSETSGTNITDYSAAGTNTAYALVAGGGNGSWFTNGCFWSYCSPSTSTSQYFRSFAGNIGHGEGMALSNGFTVSSWVLFPSSLPVGTATAWDIFETYHSAANATKTGITLFNDNTDGPYRITATINQFPWNGSNRIMYRRTANQLTNQWINITFVASPQSGTALFVNGGVVGTGSWVAQTNLCSYWYGGKEVLGGGAGQYLQGYIDDCYLTAYPFTATDATNHYLRGRSQ